MFQRQGPKAFKKDLKNIIALADSLGNPQNNFKTIHIAGTNGKGSSAHVIAVMLQSNGLKVGLYTSPHYRDFRERIKINGEYIAKSFVKNFVKTIKEKLELREVEASFFEITVAMSFAYFDHAAVDYAVIETGLGGRLDSTNIINPEVCLITNISLDHTAFLGNTLKSIAKEKAGIIKKNTPVVIGEYQKEVANVFKKKASKLKAPISWAKDSRFLKVTNGFEDDPFLQKNIRSAIALYQKLSQIDRTLQKDKVLLADSIKQFKKLSNYIGRWQILQKDPLVIADSAHNIAGLSIVFKKVAQRKHNQLHIVFGMVADKDPHNVYNLLPKDAVYYFVAAKIPRAKDSKTLLEETKKYELVGRKYSSVKKGLSIAKRKAKKNDLILVVGSIFVVAEVV